MLTGSIQVPADGQPIVTLHDGPTLGGYPKIAWIDPRDLPASCSAALANPSASSSQRAPGKPAGLSHSGSLEWAYREPIVPAAARKASG